MKAEAGDASSEELLQTFARDRSEAAFRELVRRHLPLVYSTARRVGNGDGHLAEDVVQVVFRDLAAKAGRISSGTVVAGWLHQHAWFTASKTIRGERRRVRREQESMAMQAMHGSGEEADPERLRPVLDEAMTELNPGERDALVLRFFERADLRSVGRALGVSEDAAQKRVARGLEKLRGLLAARGVPLSAAGLTGFLGVEASTAPPALAQSVAAGSLAAGAGFSLASLLGGAKVQMMAGAALAGALIWQAKTASELRSDLQQARAEMAAVVAENERLRPQVVSEEDMLILKKQLSELHKLRGEVSMLRREYAAATNALAAAGADSVEFAESAPEEFAFALHSQFFDASSATFERLLQSGFPPVTNPSDFTLILEPTEAGALTDLLKRTENVGFIAQPRITTKNGREATVEVTGLPLGEPGKVGLALKVLPTAVQGTDSTDLKISVIRKVFQLWDERNGIPLFRTNSQDANVQVAPGQMLVIGRAISNGQEMQIQIVCVEASIMNARGEPVQVSASRRE